jgi:ankyrin repeat protein
MRNADPRPTGGRPSRSWWWTTIAFTSVIAGALSAVGCSHQCQAGDPRRLAAFEAAWLGDIEKMRGLIAQDRALANARACSPRGDLITWIIAWRTGAGETSVLHVAARQGHDDFVRLLLASGAEVDARDRLVATPLHLAAQYGHDEVVGLLLAAHANVDSRKNGGLTPLHLAANYGRFPVVKRLLAARADTNAREGGRWTPLHRAASEGHENVVRLLLAEGADAEAVDDQGASPLQYAVLNRHRAVIELLTAHGVSANGEHSGPSALGQAARDGDPEGVRLLLSKGVDVDVRDKNGLTPLQTAINRRPGGDADWQEARLTEERTVVELLLEAGADVEVRGRNGNRPLHTAAQFGRVDMAELLLLRGAEIDARNDWNWTPLHFAVNQHEADMVAVLLKNGADVHSRNNAGHAPLGEIFGDARIEALLRSHGAR